MQTTVLIADDHVDTVETTHGYLLMHGYNVTVAYDAASGTALWASTYNGPENWMDVATGIGVTPDGTKVVVTGSASNPASVDYVTVAYAAK